MLHTSPLDLVAVRKILPGTIVYFKWANGVIQEAVKMQDSYQLPSTSFVFLEELPDTTALEDVPVIVVDENSKWHLEQ